VEVDIKLGVVRHKTSVENKENARELVLPCLQACIWESGVELVSVNPLRNVVRVELPIGVVLQVVNVVTIPKSAHLVHHCLHKLVFPVQMVRYVLVVQKAFAVVIFVALI